MTPYEQAARDHRPNWWTDPRPGDAVETDGGLIRTVLSRPDGNVEYRDHYGDRAVITLESWRRWADRNRAKIDRYGD